MSDKITPFPERKHNRDIKAGRISQCPICKNPPHDAFSPFCSKRCADVDLSRWFTGAYAIAGQDGEVVAAANDMDDPNDDAED